MSDRSIEFAGESFAVADKIGLMPLMRFAHLADSGVDSEDMAGLAAMYDLLEQCIAEQDWSRFQRAATKSRADGDDLMAAVQAAIAVISERPTGRPSDSSAGLTVIEPKSESEPVSSVQPELQLVRELELAGRADKAEFIVQRMRASAS